MARQQVRPAEALVVVVGDAPVIEAPIRALDLGPIERVPVEAILGEPPPGRP